MAQDSCDDVVPLPGEATGALCLPTLDTPAFTFIENDVLAALPVRKPPLGAVHALPGGCDSPDADGCGDEWPPAEWVQ